MVFNRFDILTVDLPFRMTFGHSLAERRSSTNVWVRACLADGTVGYGEAVPRAYVTGETVEDVVQGLARTLQEAAWRKPFAGMEELAEALLARYDEEGPECGGAARCALELALLDAVGKSEGRSCMELLGGMQAEAVEYTAVLPFARDAETLELLGGLVRRNGMRTAKVKVGQGAEPDARMLRCAREAIGPEGDLRVDANAAWDPNGALAALRAMEEFGVRAVEQPLPADDLDGLARVAEALEIPVIVDESFHTLADARRLVERKACDALNIRISKCGGLLTARRILEWAREQGVPCQMGAQVGESGVLTAAGRAFACAFPELIYREGAAGRLLLEEDLTQEETSFGPGGMAPALPGPGLGVTVDEERLARHSRGVVSV